MEKTILENQVCGLLARQLAEEQVEVMKHQAIVENIKKTIVERKRRVVEELTLGRLFCIDGSKVRVTDVMVHVDDNSFRIMLTYVGAEEADHEETDTICEWYDFAEAAEPDFLSTTGIVVGWKYVGHRQEPVMLEQVRRDKR